MPFHNWLNSKEHFDDDTFVFYFQIDHNPEVLSCNFSKPTRSSSQSFQIEVDHLLMDGCQSQTGMLESFYQEDTHHQYYS